ncbi:MAG TPA: hypothetical protein VIK37_03070, partial [Candidatus Saccharimonadales bacterium]
MSPVQKVVRHAETCAFRNQLPKRITELVERFDELTHTQRCRARSKMKRLQLHERMARRATEIASVNIGSAERVIEAMIRIFGREATIAYLMEHNYTTKLLHRSERHKKHGDHRNAEILRAHVAHYFGEGELLVFYEENRIAVRRKEPSNHETLRRSRWGF